MRNGDTYRSDRRNMWGALKGMPWEAFNGHLARNSKGLFGPLPVRSHIATLSRSKYTPHQGKREMARRERRLLIHRIREGIAA